MAEETCAACDCAQIFAATPPGRVRSLTLTDCGAHDNWPPDAFEPSLAMAAAGGLRGALAAPTLVVRDTDDITFDAEWSHSLARTIPGTRRRIEHPGARLFLPEERWADFNAELRQHWQAAAPSGDHHG